VKEHKELINRAKSDETEERCWYLMRNMTIVELTRSEMPRSKNILFDRHSGAKALYRKHGITQTLLVVFLFTHPLSAAYQTLTLGQSLQCPALCRYNSRSESEIKIDGPIIKFQQKLSISRDDQAQAGSRLKLTILRSSSPQNEPPQIDNDFNATFVSKIPKVEPERELTAQEKMQIAMGIEVETEEDRLARIAKREALVAKKEQEKLIRLGVAVASGFAAVLNYAYQYTHPITSLSLLADMQKNSEELTVIGKNGRPTVVDFWAPWCENCKASAPTLSAIEAEYKSQVNFVLINGDLAENWGLIERFGVDAIPHLALLDSDGTVETALIGPIPKSVLRADLDILLSNAQVEKKGGAVVDDEKLKLPHMMYDAFRNKPDLKKVSFD